MPDEQSTVQDMETPTLQDIFDLAWGTYVIQGKPRSYDAETGECQYRGPHGRRCAVGLLFEHDVQRGDVSTALSRRLLQKYAPELADLDIFQGLRALQTFHDVPGPISDSLRAYAVAWRLTCPTPST